MRCYSVRAALAVATKWEPPYNWGLVTPDYLSTGARRHSDSGSPPLLQELSDSLSPQRDSCVSEEIRNILSEYFKKKIFNI